MLHCFESLFGAIYTRILAGNYPALARIVDLLRRAGKLDEVPPLLGKAKSSSISLVDAGLSYCCALYEWLVVSLVVTLYTLCIVYIYTLCTLYIVYTIHFLSTILFLCANCEIKKCLVFVNGIFSSVCLLFFPYLLIFIYVSLSYFFFVLIVSSMSLIYLFYVSIFHLEFFMYFFIY